MNQTLINNGHKIHHAKILEDNTAKSFFDNESLVYVCTTELKDHRGVFDIFYRNTPHPVYGNHYVGLNRTTVCNADSVEELGFIMIQIDGVWQYSRYNYDFVEFSTKIGTEFVDGGRFGHRRTSKSNSQCFTIKDGKFV